MGDGWRWVAALVLAAAVGLAALPVRAPEPAAEWGRPRRTAEGLAVFPMPPDTSGLAFSLVVCYHNQYKILWWEGEPCASAGCKN